MDAPFQRKELEFAVFCIENTAASLRLKGDEVYRLLTEKSDILDDYIIPCFDALHTQGKEYIVNDIYVLSFTNLSGNERRHIPYALQKRKIPCRRSHN